MKYSTTWIKSRKSGKSIPFRASCTVDSILKNGMKGRETVTRERLIDLSNTSSKTNAMNELISITRDALISKVTKSMNGSFLGCFHDNNDKSKSTDVVQFSSEDFCRENCKIISSISCESRCPPGIFGIKDSYCIGNYENHQNRQVCDKACDEKPPPLTTTKCIKECSKKGYAYAATTSNWNCRCSNDNYELYEEAAECKCETNVAANKQCVYRVNGSKISYTNVARGKRTSQSSTGWGGLSARAVDGNANGNYRGTSVTHTNLHYKP